MPEDIYNAVIEAMQAAEELGGPDLPDYIVLMGRIAAEANRRREVAFTMILDMSPEEARNLPPVTLWEEDRRRLGL